MKLIHFTADWCNPCKKLTPIIEEFISSNTDIEYIKIDVDAESEIAVEYEVRSIPTLIVIKDNIITNKHHGIATKDQLKSLFNK